MIDNLTQSRDNMVTQQIRPVAVAEPRVLAALTKVKREDFISEGLQALAYADMELPIGCGQTMLAPLLTGRLLQILNVQADETVLEVGTGSGYFTALLAQLAKQVISVELIAELSQQAQQRLQGLDNVILAIGDACHGWDLADRVEVMVVTAALPRLPESYLHNLQIGGRLLAVVGQAPVMEVKLIKRLTETKWQTDNLFETLIPAMINNEPEVVFEF